MPRRAVGTLISCVVALACLDTVQVDLRLVCDPNFLTAPDSVPVCLHLQGAITTADRDSSVTVFTTAQRVRDSLARDTLTASLTNALYLTRALRGISSFYSRGLFADSARFHRMMDQVAVNLELARGSLRIVNGHAFPATTPFLSWKVYTNLGAYFQPVETGQLVGYILPSTGVPTDTVLDVGEQLWRYGLWRTSRRLRYPVWEYEFAWTSGGVPIDPPWLSGMAQGAAMMVYSECFARTGAVVWRNRAMEAFHSLLVPWDSGGVLLPDTTHGYWFEEYHPVVQVWNGAAVALVQVGYLSQLTQDPEVQQVYAQGLKAMKFYTPLYDTGSWTLYSRTQGLNSRAYHRLHVQLADLLYSQSGDPWWKTTADRWRSYTPPPGVP